MDNKRMFALVFAFVMAIVVNAILFGGLFMLVNP